jgi:hypothetical protein
MPWYTVTISAAGILAGRSTELEKAFEAAFNDGVRANAVSLWWSHNQIDGSVTYFFSATPDEIGLASIAPFSPIECKEPNLAAVSLLHTRELLTTEGRSK